MKHGARFPQVFVLFVKLGTKLGGKGREVRVGVDGHTHTHTHTHLEVGGGRVGRKGRYI